MAAGKKSQAQDEAYASCTRRLAAKTASTRGGRRATRSRVGKLAADDVLGLLGGRFSSTRLSSGKLVVSDADVSGYLAKLSRLFNLIQGLDPRPFSVFRHLRQSRGVGVVRPRRFETKRRRALRKK